ncbi:MAG: multicomponent K+:H+ antiporter subunit E [Brevundimonas sp.]|jgi:multicomponent K+:H+ antiporter subunit E|uniref:Na+/H+ antiporter subunit E n=1 Tax=Brevundimonas sp. GW460-12-10-14-LB2 TaxID=1827469 RepID=UPI0007BCAA69|nr:Na+/H+ antiporter subunit E [Brevundimonas sp. GW460-12-10-14-LB2]ANC53689.1 cation:proton antiporter [Brevundimonas sp. GW460-12-10-14-LB2]
MRRVLPYPILSLGLFVASILLSASVAPPALALAVLLALLAPIIMLALGVDRVRVKAPMTIMRLAIDVVGDIVRSNWAVSHIILGRRRHERTSGFIHIPLDLRDRYGLAVLAIIITSTPGTLWVEYEAATGRLLLHVLDLVDEETWVRLIKDRYERRLMEIFE